jgi:acyl dehydratase
MMQDMERTVAERLKELGVTGILITAAQEGYVKDVACEMPTCYCPEELGGKTYFEPVPEPLSDWMPTQDHIILKSEGGKLTIDNVRLAHRLCNRIHFNEAAGKPIDGDLKRVEAAKSGAQHRGETASRTRKITKRDIELFTEMTGDRNPLHYDEEAAGKTRFGGIIVQGGVTSGLLNAVVAEELPGPGSVFLHTDWSFKAPVYPGDEITAEVEVLERRPDKPITRLRTTVKNQDGVVVLDGMAVVFTEPLHAN